MTAGTISPWCFTERQALILDRIAAGAGNEVIAKELCLSNARIRNIASDLYDRMGINDAGNPRVLAAVRWTKWRLGAPVV